MEKMLFSDKESKFIHDNDTLNLLYKEIINLAALDKYDEFKALCEKIPSWTSAVVLTNEYDLSVDGDQYGLRDDGLSYKTMLHCAINYFPDHYTNYIAKKTVKDIKQKKKKWADFSNTYTQKELVFNILNNNLKETYKTINSFITKNELYKVIFFHKYHELREIGQNILKEDGQKILDEKILNNAFDIYHYNESKNFKLLLEDLLSFYPERKNDIKNLLAPILFKVTENFHSRGLKQELAETMIVKNLFDLNDYVVTRTSNLKVKYEINIESEIVENADCRLVSKFFNFTEEQIKKIEEDRINFFKEMLPEKESLTKRLKL